MENVEKEKRRSREWLEDCFQCRDFKYACYAKDQAVRDRSSSGGLCAMLARRTIDEGGAVYGAAYADDFRSVKIVRVLSMEDYYAKISKSKYSQCDMPDMD